MMVGFWILVIWLVSSVVRSQQRSGTTPRHESPHETAARRFAAGEIDESEFDRICLRLQQNNDGSPSASKVG